MAPELPGFYYDEEKKRYFKIVNGSKNSSTDKYHNNNVQAQNRRKDFEINSTRKIRRKDVSSIGKGKLWAVNRVQEALIRQERGQVEIHQGNYLQDPISLKLQTQGANFNFL